MNKTIQLAILALLLNGPVAFAASHDHHEKKPEAPAAAEYKYKTPKLNRAQFDQLLAKPEQLTIIDVRRPDELTAKGGFPVYLSIQASEIENSLGFIPKDRSIVTVSNHAGRAGAAADLLASKGFKVVGAVGAQNYEEEGGKLAKIVPPEPKK
ncbi:rhodanese-like domain-containing protein [Methylomonas sp. SURF-1]|uniref:Rhodanese-like domain-containing protein n=1 Tax=Methylomonas aurea TaxID=2952224 RepID=A0ABT1UJR1_9GAMM|nr:rhodanese-like domain-containing protein [Methylomonas sp. SURF-1]MCQ8181924.1 rhodanese-like domain-containing protein [Methylomonas sp. SURF-1]